MLSIVCLNEMKDVELPDTQNLADTRELAIDRVGVKNLRHPIVIKDKAKSLQHTVATIQLTVDLPHHFKGTHMSRFIEVLNQQDQLHVKNIFDIVEQLKERLESEQAHVEFEFPFFLTKSAPVTGASGMLDYLVRFNANASEVGRNFVLTVTVPVTTLCPCSKAISKRGAHNQRGAVTFSVGTEEPVWIEDLILLVEKSASSDLYSLLKRPDEKAVTEQAYDNPVFVEDLVRNIAACTNADSNILCYRIEAENFESIHNHNAYAMISKNWPQQSRG